HRDIKPQNILMDDSGKVKITDFGIAKALSETRMTETNQVIGSVQYISPEQAKGQSTDERTDIYSFGVMLFELLTGVLPYQAETAVSNSKSITPKEYISVLLELCSLNY